MELKIIRKKRSLTIYLDQNIYSGLREDNAAKEALSKVLQTFRKSGAIFVYSDVHVEECRAFYAPEQCVRVIDEWDGYYIQPAERLGLHR